MLIVKRIPARRLVSERVETVTEVPQPVGRKADPAAMLILHDASDLPGVEVLSMWTRGITDGCDDAGVRGDESVRRINRHVAPRRQRVRRLLLSPIDGADEKPCVAGPVSVRRCAKDARQDR